MPIILNESESTAKAWSPVVTANAAGLSLAALPVLFVDRRFDVPAMTIPCTAPGTYRLALVAPPPPEPPFLNPYDAHVALVDESRGLPVGFTEVVYLARWPLAEGQTCADVDIEVTRRTLAPRLPTIVEIPVYEDQVDEETGEIRSVQVGTQTIEVPPEPLPEPTVVGVSPVLVLPRAPTVQERIAAIDAATDARIAEGFVFRGLRFSASLEAQTRSLGTFGAREMLAYPLRWNSLDDGESITLDGPDDVAEFHLTGMAFVRTCVDAGTVLKDAIRAEVGS